MFKKLLILLAALAANSANCAQESSFSLTDYNHNITVESTKLMLLIKTNLENKKFDLVKQLITENYLMLTELQLSELSDCIKLKIKDLKAVANIYKFDLKFLKKIFPDTGKKIFINMLVNIFCDGLIEEFTAMRNTSKNKDSDDFIRTKILPKIKYIAATISVYKWIKNSYKKYYNYDIAKEIKDLKKIDLIISDAIAQK